MIVELAGSLGGVGEGGVAGLGGVVELEEDEVGAGEAGSGAEEAGAFAWVDHALAMSRPPYLSGAEQERADRPRRGYEIGKSHPSRCPTTL